jgi:Flp pilus assembly pilin Flp
MRFVQFVSQFHREESGQDMLEYALVLGAVLAAVVLGSGNLSTTISNGMTTINTKIAADIASLP